MLKYIKSFGITLMICSRSLTQLLNFPRSSIYVMLIGFILVLLTSYKKIYYMKKILVILFVGLAFLISLFASGMNSVTVEYFLYFVCFGVTAMLIPVIADFRMVMRCVLLIGVLLVWPYFTIDYAEIIANVGGERENFAAVLMDISYKTLVFIITGMVLTITDESKIFKIVSVVTVIVYTIIAFIYGARGALLSIAVFLFVFWIIQAKDNTIRNRRIVVSGIILLAIIFLFVPMIEYAYNFFESRGIEARSLERIYVKLGENSSMSEGRDILFKKAIEGFYNSPIWGHGIGSFDNYSGVYPHNIILQLLYEGGILLAFPLLYLFCRGFISLFSFRYTKLYRYFILFLLCSGIVELFVSSHLWMSHFFWLFIGQTLINNKYIIKAVCQKSV